LFAIWNSALEARGAAEPKPKFARADETSDRFLLTVRYEAPALATLLKDG
jgi:hypothetical protein